MSPEVWLSTLRQTSDPSLEESDVLKIKDDVFFNFPVILLFPAKVPLANSKSAHKNILIAEWGDEVINPAKLFFNWFT